MIDHDSFRRAGNRRRPATIVVETPDGQAKALLADAVRAARIVTTLAGGIVDVGSAAYLALDERASRRAPLLPELLTSSASADVSASAVAPSRKFVEAAWSGPTVTLRAHLAHNVDAPLSTLQTWLQAASATLSEPHLFHIGCEVPIPREGVAAALVAGRSARASMDCADEGFGRIVSVAGFHDLVIVGVRVVPEHARAAVEELSNLAESLDGLAYASIAIDSDFSRQLLGHSYGITAWRSRLSEEEVLATLDRSIPDVFPVQFLSGGHVESMPNLQEIAYRRGDLYAVSLEPIEAWLPGNVAVDDVRTRGWTLLAPLLS